MKKIKYNLTGNNLRNSYINNDREFDKENAKSYLYINNRIKFKHFILLFQSLKFSRNGVLIESA